MERNLSDSASLLVAVGLAVSRLVNQIDNPNKTQDFNTAKFFRSRSEVTFEEPQELNCGCRLEKL
jgi:hypothetical protein